jgi:hypothetical protein
MGLKEDIRKTIEYSKKYRCALSPNDLAFRLISATKYNKKEIIECATNFLAKKQSLPNFNKQNYTEKLNFAKELVNRIGKNKNILLIGVTGSVAAGFPDKNDDIDLLIITKKDSLWLTRLSVKWFLWVNSIPQRKYGKREEANQFCFNIWIDESKLCLPKAKQNLKNSIDLVLMKPLLKRNDIYAKFLGENDWAKNYVINGYEQLIQKEKNDNKEAENRNPLKIMNYLAFLIQYGYMKPKLKKEIVSLKQALFHPNG